MGEGLDEHKDPRLVNGDPQSDVIKANDDEVTRSQKEVAVAAVIVQRLYRGYRIRRNIADAAVMAQKFGWWNVVDGAMLHETSSQFYAYSAPQNAAQRWVRLKKKAAKVGKGLSKNEWARQLALQHWLEAIDPRHRYGHNLRFYYEQWSRSETKEPFFYWLDVGEGKEVELECCPRSKLQSQQISYLSPKERKWFEVLIEEGNLVYKMTEKPVHTPKGEKWIFVMSTSGKLYVGKKEKGKLQHSSFLAGGATIAAGRLLVNDGKIELMEAHSGHYHPTPDNFQQLIKILVNSGVDLTMAKVQYFSDDLLSTQTSSASLNVETEKIAKQPTVKEEIVEEEILDEQLQNMVLHDNAEACGVDGMISGMDDEDLPKRDRALSKLTKEELENIRGFKVEIVHSTRVNGPGEEKTSDKAVRSSGDSASEIPRVMDNKHKLFGPAMRTFSRIDADYCSRAVQSHDPRSCSELNPEVKKHLLRRLSMTRHVVPPT